MLTERIEHKWIKCFAGVFLRSKVSAGDTVAILSETQSRQLNVQLAELALLELGAKAFHIVIPTAPVAWDMPARSNGWVQGMEGLQPAVDALASSSMVVDLTVENLLHNEETREILTRGSRMLCITNEHPETLERVVTDEAMKERAQLGAALLNASEVMHVTSKAGTDLVVQLEGSMNQGAWGFCDEPGHLDVWPSGMVTCFPGAGTVNGTLVMDRGDCNLTFKRYLEEPVRLTFEDDFITGVEGESVDAELFRSYTAHWNDRNAYASSHLGWGLNERCHWESTTFYDKNDTNGGEQRAFAGNFLFSTGVNAIAGRKTAGHYDIPMRNISIRVGDTDVVENGRLLELSSLDLPDGAVPAAEISQQNYRD
jgi:2,5-dihydroxypyridine 5,6-dioxygenase